jgi:hypothetical protein
MEQFSSHGTDFHEISYFIIVRKSVEKIQFSLKSVKDSGHFTWRPTHIYMWTDNKVRELAIRGIVHYEFVPIG